MKAKDIRTRLQRMIDSKCDKDLDPEIWEFADWWYNIFVTAHQRRLLRIINEDQRVAAVEYALIKQRRLLFLWSLFIIAGGLRWQDER